MLLLEAAADLLTLAMVQKALQPNVDLQVVTIDYPRRDLPGKFFATADDESAGRVSAAPSAGPYSLLGHERSVLKSNHSVPDGLLDLGWSGALRARAIRRFDRQDYTRGAQRSCPSVLLQSAHLIFYVGEGLQTRFFLPRP